MADRSSRLDSPFSRRRALAIGGSAAAGALVMGGGGLTQAALGDAVAGKGLLRQSGSLPLRAMEGILGIEGETTEGLAHFPVARDDAKSVKGPMGITFSSAFEINGDLYFQPLRHGKQAFLNGDVPLKPQELNPFIDALLANGLTFQAMHQHYFDLTPMYWFIHFRGLGEPLAVTRAIKAALGATAISFPQKQPKNPTTPFDARRIGKILHGSASVGEEGVVTVDISRKHPLAIAGVEVNPDANISTGVQFKPHGPGKNGAAGGPDFALVSSEVNPVVGAMRASGWQVDCLYNQETVESPQLYFSHMLKTGDVYELAAEVRKGLDLTDSD